MIESKTCKECNRIIKVGKFCSKKCFYDDKKKSNLGQNNPNFRNNRISSSCKYCSKEFSISKNESTGKKHAGKYCSLNCYHRYRMENKKTTITDYEKKLHSNFSRGVRASLKNGKDGYKWTEIVGYSLLDLKTHLESKFLDGMNWGNYGKFGWHIDHIIPISHFRINGYLDEEFLKCWSLINLQPMWAKDNWAKCDLKNKNKLKYDLHIN